VELVVIEVKRYCSREPRRIGYRTRVQRREGERRADGMGKREGVEKGSASQAREGDG
jgi:hypothetical protein